jgi:hypothetical protein
MMKDVPFPVPSLWIIGIVLILQVIGLLATLLTH